LPKQLNYFLKAKYIQPATVTVAVGKPKIHFENTMPLVL
jgi:hypothetical protein